MRAAPRGVFTKKNIRCAAAIVLPRRTLYYEGNQITKMKSGAEKEFAGGCLQLLFFAPFPLRTVPRRDSACECMMPTLFCACRLDNGFPSASSVLYYIEVKKYAQICKIKVKFCVFQKFFTQTAPKAAIILPQNGKMLHANGRAALKKVNYAPRAPFKLHFFCI